MPADSAVGDPHKYRTIEASIRELIINGENALLPITSDAGKATRQGGR